MLVVCARSNHWCSATLVHYLLSRPAADCGDAPNGSAGVGEDTQAPPDGSTHWSSRKVGRLLKIHHNLVGKAWRRAGLQPHRFERYMESDDHDFESKAADFARRQ